MPTFLMNNISRKAQEKMNKSNCISVTPHLSIGDLLILKNITITNKLNITKIKISTPLIQTCSSDYDKKLEFIQNIIPWIFPDTMIELTTSGPDFIPLIKKYTYQRIPLYNYITIPNITNIDYSDTLVFHTKFRHDKLIDKCIQYIFPSLIDFFKKYKTSKKIIIMGEREIGSNLETRIHKTVSLYNHMIALKENNDVTDMTQHILTEGISFDKFLSDIEIISKCKCNIVFGIGGPTAIASAFSKESIFVIPYLNESIFKNEISANNNICENIESLEIMLTHCSRQNPYHAVEDICRKYNIEYTHSDGELGAATGIGDILFRILCIKNKLITGPFVINLVNFTKLYYKSDPINQLEFRILLINDLLNHNDISNSLVKYVFTKNSSIDSSFPYKSITQFKLLIDDITYNFDKEYIIFHTKLRHNCFEVSYSDLKSKISTFCKLFKSRYHIIIMGERIFPITEETIVHGITTVYTELLDLSLNNTIEDATIHNIYNNLSYEQYKKDVSIISNAKYNICFGWGGQLCTSLILGKSTIYFGKTKHFNDLHLNNNNHYQFTDLQLLFKHITANCGIDTE